MRSEGAITHPAKLLSKYLYIHAPVWNGKGKDRGKDDGGGTRE